MLRSSQLLEQLDVKNDKVLAIFQDGTKKIALNVAFRSHLSSALVIGLFVRYL